MIDSSLSYSLAETLSKQNLFNNFTLGKRTAIYSEKCFATT
jgi:hypothetical protein